MRMGRGAGNPKEAQQMVATKRVGTLPEDARLKQMTHRILVVEDEPDLLDAVVFALKKEGMKPIPCKDGEEALRIVKDAERDAETRKKEAILEAKEKAHELLTDAERQARQERQQAQALEQTLTRRDASLAERQTTLDRAEKDLQSRDRSVSEREKQVDAADKKYQQLVAQFPTLRLVIAPRYLERAERVAQLAREAGQRVAFRSKGNVDGAPVVLLDTIGELARAYALATVVFVGGSFTTRGGQNILEPAAQGKPVLFGPHMENFHDAYRALLRHDGARIVRSSDDLARTVLSLLENAAELERMRAGAAAALATLSGALERTVSALLPLLPAEVATRAPR